jgi:hypothetical protein
MVVEELLRAEQAGLLLHGGHDPDVVRRRDARPFSAPNGLEQPTSPARRRERRALKQPGSMRATRTGSVACATVSRCAA